MMTTTRNSRSIKFGIERMVRLLHEALGGGVSEDLAAALRNIARNSPQIERSVVVWIDLVSVLVQGTEPRHPAGQGRLKKDQVKAAIRYLLRSQRFAIPNIPAYLEPFVIDVAADLSIDIIVLITNQHGLWNAPAPVPSTPRAAIGAGLEWLARVTQPVWARLIEALGSAWERLQQWSALTPELRAALDSAVKAGLVKEKMELLGEVPSVIIWVGDHRPQVIAAVQLVSEGVQEAESFLSKTGPEKKEYACELILATLEAAGYPVGGGLVREILQPIIGCAIDSVVNLFNKYPAHDPAFKHGAAV